MSEIIAHILKRLMRASEAPLVVCAALLPICGSLCAATLRVQNFSDDGSQALLLASSGGILFPRNSGSVAVGTFRTLCDASIEQVGLSALLADFEAFGGTITSPIRVGDANAYDIAGLFSATITAPISGAGSITGKPIFVVIGNGSTLMNSTEIAVLKDDDVFPSEPAASVTNVFIYEPSTTILVGRIGAPASTDIGQFPTLRIGFGDDPPPPSCPEPAGLVLTLLGGGLSLFRRRRH